MRAFNIFKMNHPLLTPFASQQAAGLHTTTKTRSA